MSYQTADGKWHYPGSTQTYASQGAADYYGSRDAGYNAPSTTDPTTGITITGYGTNVKSEPQTGLSYSDYGIDPITGIQTEEKATTVKAEQLINPTEQIWGIDRRDVLTDKEIQERGVRKIGGKSVSTFAKRKIEYKKKRKEGQAQYEYEQYLKYKDFFGNYSTNEPYGGGEYDFGRGAEESKLRALTQKENTLYEIGYGGQVNYAPKAVQILQERRAQRQQTALKMEYQKQYGNINPQISEAAYEPARNLGTTTIQKSPYLKVGEKVPENNGSIARGIEKQALAEGATAIQIYNAEGQPVGKIAAKGSADVLENMLAQGQFSYRFSSPYMKVGDTIKVPSRSQDITENRARNETTKFNRQISNLVEKEAIIDIYNSKGEKVSETSGQRAIYDIRRATEKYGEVSVGHHYTTETLYKAVANAPNEELRIGKIGNQIVVYPSIYEAGVNFAKNLGLEAARIGGMLGSGLLKETEGGFGGAGLRAISGRQFGTGEDYGIGENVNKFVEKNRGDTAIGIITSGEPNTRSKTFLATSLGLDIGSMVFPLKPKIPFVSAARLGKSEVITVGIGSRIRPIFTLAEGKLSRGFDITSIGKKGFKDIAETFVTKSGRGAEIDALGITEAKLLTQEKNISKLQKAGIFSQESADLLRAGKTGVTESKGITNKPFRTLGEKPYEQIPAGKPTEATKEFFKKQKITLEGSSIDVTTLKEEYAGIAGDFDVKVKNAAEALKLGTKYVKEVNPTLKESGIEFRAEFTKGGSAKIYRYEQVPNSSLAKSYKFKGMPYQEAKHGKFISEELQRNPQSEYSGLTENLEFHHTGKNKGFLLTREEHKTLHMMQEGIIPKQTEFYERFKITEPYSNYASNLLKGKLAVKGKFKRIGKVGEFLSSEDPEAAGQLSKTHRVLGVKTDQGIVKTEGIKMRTRKYQLHRRTAEFTSLQPTKEGVKIMTSKGRVKDLPKGYASYMTAAFLKRQAGENISALKLEQAAATIKRIGSKEINFEKFFAERRMQKETIHLVKEEKPNLLNTIAGGTSKVISKTNPTPLINTIPNAQGITNISKTKEKKSPLSKEAVAPKESPISKGKSIVNKSYVSKSPLSKPSRTLSLTSSFTESSLISKISKPSYSFSKSKPSLTSPTRSKPSPISNASKPSPISSKSSHSLTSSYTKSTSPKSKLTSKGSKASTSPISKTPSPITNQPAKSKPTPSTITNKPPPSRTTFSPPGTPPSIPPIIPPPNRRRPPLPFGQLNAQTVKRNQPKPPKPKLNFLGNAPVSEITGLYKRPEVIYGQKKTAKLVRYDITKSKKGNFVSLQGRKGIATKAKSMFTKPKKKKGARLKKWI